MNNHECVKKSEIIEARKSGDNEKLKELFERMDDKCVFCRRAYMLGMSEKIEKN